MNAQECEHVIKALAEHVRKQLTLPAKRMWMMELRKYSFDAGMAAYNAHYMDANTFPTLRSFSALCRSLEPRFNPDPLYTPKKVEDWEYTVGELMWNMLANYRCACGKETHQFRRTEEGGLECVCSATEEDRIRHWQRYHDKLREKARETFRKSMERHRR